MNFNMENLNMENSRIAGIASRATSIPIQTRLICYSLGRPIAIQFTPGPYEIEPPKIVVQVLTADILIHADDGATDQSIAALGGVCVNVSTSIRAGLLWGRSGG